MRRIVNLFAIFVCYLLQTNAGTVPLYPCEFGCPYISLQYEAAPSSNQTDNGQTENSTNSTSENDKPNIPKITETTWLPTYPWLGDDQISYIIVPAPVQWPMGKYLRYFYNCIDSSGKLQTVKYTLDSDGSIVSTTTNLQKAPESVNNSESNLSNNVTEGQPHLHTENENADLTNLNDHHHDEAIIDDHHHDEGIIDDHHHDEGDHHQDEGSLSSDIGQSEMVNYVSYLNNNAEGIKDDHHHTEEGIVDDHHHKEEGVIEDHHHDQGIIDDHHKEEGVIEDHHHDQGIIDDHHHDEGIIDDHHHDEGTITDHHHDEGIIDDHHHDEGIIDDHHHDEGDHHHDEGDHHHDEGSFSSDIGQSAMVNYVSYVNNNEDDESEDYGDASWSYQTERFPAEKSNINKDVPNKPTKPFLIEAFN